MRGESVVLMAPSTEYDENKDPITTWTEIPLDNVLFGKPSTDDIEQTLRENGVQASYSLAIPKTYQSTLRGFRVLRERTGAVYEVVGDPEPLPIELCPTPWNRTALVVRFDG